MNLLQRMSSRQQPEKRWGIQDLIAAMSTFAYGGHSYQVQQTLAGTEIMPSASGFGAYLNALKGCPPAFAAQLVRSMVLSQARFVFRSRRSSQTPGRLFGTQALGPLERPWPNATTSSLVSAMEWHAGVSGNAFVRSLRDRLALLNPAWVTLLLGSEEDPGDPSQASDATVVGYLYHPGGLGSGKKPITLTTSEIAHWAPIPDPENPFVGMSWLTPAIREVEGDRLATEHKLKFFRNGATPNMVVKGIPAVNDEEFRRVVQLMDRDHSGVENAYKTLYLVAGADATVVGSDLKEMDFKTTQGAGETRIAMLARVPTVVLQSAEGQQGSALNAGNFGQARRLFADSWVFPTLQGLDAALATIINVPSDAELWHDTTDMPFLREDAADLADIQQKQASTIRLLTDGGYAPASVIGAVQSNDFSKLVHSGLWSVQLQKPNQDQATAPAGGN